jgi:hypothetical protein
MSRHLSLVKGSWSLDALKPLLERLRRCPGIEEEVIGNRNWAIDDGKGL